LNLYSQNIIYSDYRLADDFGPPRYLVNSSLLI